MSVKPIKDGEWIYPIQSGYILECCDCGLQHKMDFVVMSTRKTRLIINDSEIAFRCYRIDKKKKKGKKRRIE